MVFVLLPVGAALAITLGIVFAMRSTKEFPKNFAQFRCEAIYQWLGLVGVVDDIHNRNLNRIGKKV